MATLSGTRVLVTGGAGFIGSSLCDDLLACGNEVVCLDNFSTGHEENLATFRDHPKFTLITGDIRDPEMCRRACDGATVVLHEAALGSVPRSIRDPQTTNEVNVGGFVNMLVAARDAGVKRFVYAASSSAYGDSPGLPKVEEVVGNPLSPYAVTKYVNELYAKVFGQCYGMETVGLRYFNVFGRRQDPNGPYAAVIPKFIQLLLRHESPLIHGDGSHSRDFTYIDNVVRMNHLAATSTSAAAINEVFNTAGGERTTLNRLAELLKEYLAAHDPSVAAVPILHGPDRAGDIPHSLASIEKARRILGYEPLIGFEEGLRRTTGYFFHR